MFEQELTSDSLSTRIQKEQKNLEKVGMKPAEGILLAQHKENPRHYDVVIQGPKVRNHLRL